MRQARLALAFSFCIGSLAAAQPPLPAGGDAATDPPGLQARLGVMHFRHNGAAMALAFSPDGKLLAVAGNDQRIQLWDPATAKLVRTIPTQGPSILRIEFSNDGAQILGLSQDATMRTWNVASGEAAPAASQSRYYPPNLVAWAPEQKRILAAGQNGALQLFDAAGMKELRSWNAHPHQPSALALSPDGKLAVSIGSENRPLLWDTATGKEARPLEPSPVPRSFAASSAFAFSPDGKLLTQGSFDRVLPVWDTTTGKILRRIEMPQFINGIYSLTFSPDGKHLAARLSDRSIRVWGMASGLELRSFEGSSTLYGPLAFSPNSDLLAAGHGMLLRLWEVRAERERFPAQGHTGTISSLLILDDNKLLASTSSDGTLRVWDIAAKSERARAFVGGSGFHALSSASEPKSFQLIALNGSGTYVVGERSLQISDSRPFTPAGAARTASPNGRWLAQTPNEAIVLQDTYSGRQLRLTSRLAKYVQMLQFSPDNRLLGASVQGSTPEPHSLRVWETVSGREVPLRMPDSVRVAPVRTFAFSRDARLLAVLDYNNGLHVIEVATGVVRNSRLASAESPLASMMFGGDGTVLYLGMSNGHLRIRDIVHGSEAGPYRLHTHAVSSMTLSRDGSLLATGSGDAAIVVCATEPTPLKRPAPPPAAAGNLDRWWSELGLSDGTRVSQALWSLQQHPETALALIRERFRPSAPQAAPSKEQLEEWVRALDSDVFAEREKASRALQAAAEAALPVLQAALNGNPSDELRRRATILLRSMSGPLPPSKLRPFRVLELLDRIGPPARPLLLELAKGPADADFRAELVRIIDRLEHAPR